MSQLDLSERRPRHVLPAVDDAVVETLEHDLYDLCPLPLLPVLPVVRPASQHSMRWVILALVALGIVGIGVGTVVGQVPSPPRAVGVVAVASAPAPLPGVSEATEAEVESMLARVKVLLAG